MLNDLEKLKPTLREPFPDTPEVWKCPITGWKVTKREMANLAYREKLLRAAEKDEGFQADIMAACKESLLLWINVFVWTFHQFDEDGDTGQRVMSEISYLTNRVKCVPVGCV